MKLAEDLQTGIRLFLELWSNVSRIYKLRLALLVALMVLGSMAEAFSIGAVMPFIAVMVAPDSVATQIGPLNAVVAFARSLGSEDLKLVLTLLFCMSVLVAGVLRFLTLTFNVRLGHAIGHDLSTKCYELTLHQPYAVHVGRNSADVIATMFTKIDTVVHDVIHPTLTLISSSLIAVAILAMLLMVDAGSALAIIGFLGLFYFLATTLARHRIAAASATINSGTNTMLKYLQEGLGAIRDVILEGKQGYFLALYLGIDKKVRNAKGLVQILGQSPRYLIEVLGLITVSVLAYRLSLAEQYASSSLPFLAMLALGAQRLIPIVQQGYVCLAAIFGSSRQLREVLALLDQKVISSGPQTAGLGSGFRSLELKNVSYGYSSAGRPVLTSVSMTIRSGDHVGIVGPNGSGKSTLLDIMMGLSSPTGGSVLINGKELTPGNNRWWMNSIAHVSQSFFLSDSSFKENIAFGCSPEDIDSSRLETAATATGVGELIKRNNLSYDSLIGERGKALSGGERQRIGLSRALYKQAPILVLDEATSSLDDEGEEELISAIERLYGSMTIIMVAHRLKSLRFCNRIFIIENGAAREIGGYADLCTMKELPSALGLETTLAASLSSKQ